MTETTSAGYTSQYYDTLDERGRKSAAEIVPMVMELVRPRSVIDVGCGRGAWLSVFHEHGVSDIRGLDGAWVDRNTLKIPQDRFSVQDLTRPVHPERTFDLAMSLEVAEHLPPESAASFVESLTALAAVVLFSAAIPFQGGADHVNEQWPEYWVELFRQRGFVAIDCIRRRVWNNDKVAWWYAQNMLLFANQEHVAHSPALERELAQTNLDQLSVVHPRKFEKTMRGMGELFVSWLERTKDDIDRVVPADAMLILVDDALLGPSLSNGRATIRLDTAGDGRRDDSLIHHVASLREQGYGFLVFTWPAFWWFQRYAVFHEHLKSAFRCAVANERLVVFDLRDAHAA